MLGRLFAVASPCLALLAVVDCGTSTTVSTPSTFDAGCANPSVVHDAGPVDQVVTPEAGAPACPAGVCNYQAQTGCPTNQACRPQFTASSPDVSPGCEAAGTGKSGAACAKGGDCAVGYYCSADGACHKQCCNRDWSACDPGESCFRQLLVKAGGVVTDSGMDLCFPVGNCDLLDPKSCAQGSACTIVDPTGAVACVPASTAQPGDVCGATVACAAGARCVQGKDGDPSRCRAFCRAEVCGEPVCAPDQGICTHYDNDPAGVGECTPG
jgi:hypothetical protein